MDLINGIKEVPADLLSYITKLRALSPQLLYPEMQQELWLASQQEVFSLFRAFLRSKPACCTVICDY